MPPTHLLATFAVAALLLVLLPGPSMLFIIGRSLALGRTAGLLTVVGNTLGLLPSVVLVALGVGAVVQESAVVFTLLKVVGGGYLVWLGVQAIRHRAAAGGTAAPLVAKTRSRIVRDGFVVGVSNPKTTVFFAAILPQFVDPAVAPVTSQLLVLGLVFMAVAVVCDSAWAFAAGTARVWFGSSPRRLARIQAGGGLVMIGLGGSLALTDAKG